MTKINMIRNQDIGRSRWISVLFGIFSIIAGIALGLFIPQTKGYLQAIAIIAGVIGVVVALLNIEVGLYVLVLMAYLRISDIAVHYYGLPSILQPFFLLLLAAIVIQWIRFGMPRSGWLKAALVIVAYGMVVFLSLLFAADYDKALNAFTDFLKNGIITIFLAIMIQEGPIFKKVVWVLVIAGIITGTISVFQYLTGSFTNSYWGFGQADIQNIITGVDEYRISGPIGDPNFYAQILVVLVPLALELFLSEKKLILRLLAGWALVVCSLSIIFTFSRGGAVAFAVVLLCIFIYRLRRFMYLLVIAALAIVLVFFIPSNYSARFKTITDVITGQADIRSEASLAGRASEMLVAMQMFADHPVLGVGVQNYPVYYQQYSWKIGLDPRTENREPHNLFLEVAAETGMVGFLVFMGILYVVYNSIRDSWSKFKGANLQDYSQLVVAFGIGITGYLSAAMFIHGSYPRYYWLLVGIALALPHVAENTINRVKQVGIGK